MINDEINNCCYFAVTNLSKFNFLGWLRAKKQAIINGSVDFEDALDDALNHQTIEENPQNISKLKSYTNKYNWKEIEYPAGPKEQVKFEKIIRQLHLMYYRNHVIQKQCCI